MINLFWFVLFPIIVATLLYLINAKYFKIIIIFLQVIFFIFSIVSFRFIKYNGTISSNLGNWPISVSITLRADSISSVFVMLTTFLFLMMLLFNYQKLYMNKLFMFLFMILQGLINGIFLSNDLFNLYILLEVSTIVVSILIMFKKDTRSIYDGMIYLLTNIVSMTFFLLGIGYIYKIFGALDLTFIKQHITLIQNPRHLIVPYCLLITAVGLKSAIMPLFSWLPRAHGTPSAPSIVSAILSGLYVKGGLYLFIRIQDLFNPVIDTNNLFLVMGFLTGIIGFIFALSQTDIKLILAYHTVSQIGLIIFGLSLNHTYSYCGSIYHILNHAIFKSTLFLTAGIIIDEYETRDIRKIKGVFKRMPFISIITLLAVLGITGAPFFNGSISKYLIQKGTLHSYWEYGLLIINLGTILSFIKYMSMFFGDYNGQVFKPTINQKFVITTLGLFCFIGGIFGISLIQLFFNQHFYIETKSYVIKSILYLLNIIIGVLFYNFVYKKINLFKKIREIELSFNGIILSIVVFFTFMLTYLRITI